MVSLTPTRPFKFHTIDCERPKDGFTAGRFLPFKVGPREQVLILASVHGLLLVGIIKVQRGSYTGLEEFCYLILWNPATGDHKTLAHPFSDDRDCFSIHEALFGAYHSKEDDDYKLLRVTHHPKVYIYSLKSDSWRKVESDFRRTMTNWNMWMPSDSFDENLYFLDYTTNGSCSIMRFNTKTETLKLMATPFSGNQSRTTITTWLSFRVVREGWIELWVNICSERSPNFSRFELWRMDVRDASWRRVQKSGRISSEPVCYHNQLHLMKNGNMLMFDGDCAYQLDMKTHTKDVCAYTTEKMIALSQGGKHIETMVSPNQYI